MENNKILTTKEERFLTYYDEVTELGIDWTFRSAAVALGYKNVNSVMTAVKSLRAKGHTIESTRSKTIKWKRGFDIKLTKEEKEELKQRVRDLHKK